MEGQIWLESDGIGKGCTATFIVKLGACDQNGNLQQIPQASRPSHGGTIQSGARAIASDDDGQFLPKMRYQRSA